MKGAATLLTLVLGTSMVLGQSRSNQNVYDRETFEPSKSLNDRGEYSAMHKLNATAEYNETNGTLVANSDTMKTARLDERFVSSRKEQHVSEKALSEDKAVLSSLRSAKFADQRDKKNGQVSQDPKKKSKN